MLVGENRVLDTTPIAASYTALLELAAPGCEASPAFAPNSSVERCQAFPFGASCSIMSAVVSTFRLFTLGFVALAFALDGGS